MLHSLRVPNNQSLNSSAEAPPAVLSDNSELSLPRGTHEAAAILEDFPHEGSRNLGDVLDCQQLAIPHASGPPVPSSCDTLVKRVTRKGRRRRKNKSKKKERRKKRLRKTEGGKQGRGRTLLYRRFVKRRRQQQRRMRMGKKSASESGEPVEREQVRRRRLGRAKLRQFWLQSEKYQAWRRDQSREQLLEQPGAQLAIQQLWQGLFRQGNQWQQVYQVRNSWSYTALAGSQGLFRQGSQ
jgi:hypothetical protein